jgi:hypothetical protein
MNGNRRPEQHGRHRALLLVLGAALLSPWVPAAGADTDWQTVEPGGATRCADGSPYRFHVRHASEERLLLFFNGGGACWNSATCDPQGNPTYRVNAGPGSGNDPREYDGAFALDNPDNPFGDWSQVFVSYCSGDVHLGDRRAAYIRDDGSSFAIEHRGRANADAALEYVYRHFDPQRIVVAGGSAGALASPVYAAVVAAGYPAAEVIHFAGGGAGYRLPPPTRLWEQWGTIEALPQALRDTSVSAATLAILDLYRLAARAAPRVRLHTWDTAYDAVQEQFMALLGAPGDLQPGLDNNLAELRRDLPQLRSYVAPGEFHTLLRYEQLYRIESDGVRAVDWVRALSRGDDPGNVNCHPYCDGP